MEILWSELSGGIPDSTHLALMLLRLVAATLLGAAIGYERQRAGKAAGLRTHILVAAGTTVFILACLGAGIKTNSDGISRVIQGIITGIGFVGAGSILKRETDRNVQGVTTSAGIWMTAAIGVTIGLGGLGLAIMATTLTLIILRVTIWFERQGSRSDRHT
ncbi:MAG: MgtC/SapB family protein [Pyrinomonadaceae bacterium]